MSAVAIVNVPQCQDHVVVEDYDVDKADAFDPTTWTYYQNNLAAWVPGAVLGGLAALGSLFLLLWLFSLCCRRHYWKWELEVLPANWPSEDKQKKRSKCGKLGTGLILLMWAAVIGLSVWGVIEAVSTTDSTVTDFWGVVIRGRQQLVNATTMADRALTDFGTISEGLAVLSGGGQDLGSALDPSSGTTPTASALEMGEDSVYAGPVYIRTVSSIGADLATQAGQLKSQLDATLAEAADALATVHSEGVQGLDSFIDDYHKVSVDVEDTWRYVGLITFFALLVLTSSIAAPAALSERWPRTAAFFTLALWLLTALLMLLGAGALSTGYTLSADGCLYGEAWAAREVGARVDPSSADKAVLAMRYYLGGGGASSEVAGVGSAGVAAVNLTADQAALQVYGLDVGKIDESLASVRPVLDFLESEEGRAAVAQLPLDSSARTWVEGLPSAISSAMSNLDGFTEAIDRSAFEAVYGEAKEYLCCDLTDLFYKLWIAWTADGCAALVLAFLLTLRLISLVVYN